MAATDTTSEGRRVHIDTLRQMGLAARARMCLAASAALRATSLAGIRRRHPRCTPEQALRMWMRLAWGHPLVDKVFPRDSTEG